MIRFRQTSCGSDCTGPYDVEISKPMTVRQFINELLTNYKSEWGYVGIYSKGTIFGEPRCEYRHGELVTSPLPESYLDKQIDFVDGGGGWSRSDFTLHLVGDNVADHPSRAIKIDDNRQNEKVSELDRYPLKGKEQVKIGQIIVDSDGISKVVEVYNSGSYVTVQMIPKEVFVEAFQKFIKESEVQ